MDDGGRLHVCTAPPGRLAMSYEAVVTELTVCECVRAWPRDFPFAADGVELESAAV